jgi:hypothetical protein
MKTTLLTVCIILMLIGGLMISVEASQLRQISWQDLIPETQAFDDPFEALTQDQLADLGFVARVRQLLALNKINESSPDVQRARDYEQRLTEAGVDIDGLLAKRAEIRELRRARAEAVVPALDGQRIRMPGYVLPLEFEGTQVIEFLLVPFVGACIHTPPPPPNQIVHVRLDKGIKDWGLFHPVWVTGDMSVQASTQSLFLVDGSDDINVGYSMRTRVKDVEPYQ